MAEEILYDQIETGGDPDPLGLRKKMAASKSVKKTDPLGLREKLSTRTPTSEPTPTQPTTKESPVFKPMYDWLAIPQGYKPMVPEKAVDEYSQKVNEAGNRVKGHLDNIDPNIKNLIYSHKKDLMGRIKSQELALSPGFEAAPINPQALELESRLREDVPVYDEEVNEFKAGMSENPVMLRQGLKQRVNDLSKTDKKAANDLKADIYQLDAQERRDKENKISKNIEKIKEGEYDYDILGGKVVKPEGFFGSLATSYKQKVDAFKDYDVYRSGDEKKILETINKRLEQDPDQAIPVPEGAGGHAGAMLGGQPLKPLIGGGVAGYFSGGLAATTAAAAISAPEMYKLTFGSTLPYNFDALRKKHPDLSESEVLQRAIDLTNDQANVDALSGAAMGALGAAAGFKPTGINSNLLKKSLGSALTQLGETAAKKTLEGLGVGSVGAAGQLVKNLLAKKEGILSDDSEGLAEQLIGGVGMTVGMTMVAKFPKLLKPKTYNQLLQALKNVPKEDIDATLNQLQEVGEITPEQAQEAQNNLKNHQAIDNSIKPDVPESERLKVQELIKKRNELEASLEVEDKAYHADTKEKIKKLNEQINNISKGQDRGELQQLIDKEAGNIEGYVADVLVNASENDLKKYFKEISEQAHDPNSEATTIATFGEAIVNKAKELFPVAEAPKSSISIIQPGEIKQPTETITIKPKEENIVDNSGLSTAEKVADYLGIDKEKISGKDKNSQYLTFSHEGKAYQIRISDHAPNPKREQATQMIMGYEPIWVGKDFETAKRIIDRKIYGKKTLIKNGAVINHPKYGKGKVIGHDLEKRKLDVEFNGEKKSLDSDAVEDRGWLQQNISDEIKQPTETITIKPKENAEAIRSDEGQVQQGGDELRRSTEQSGSDLQRNAQEEPIIGKTEQQTGQHQEKGIVAGQEEVGGIPPEEPTKGAGIHVEQPPTQLSFRGLQDVANEFGYEDVKSRERVSDIQERKNAEITANEWAAKGEYQKNIDDLLNKIEDKEHVPTAKQRLILEQYLANEKQKLRELPKTSAEYDAQLLKVKRIKDIGQIARQEAGAALRVPDEGSLAHPIMDEADAMAAKMEANAVNKLTEQQKAEVEAQVEKYKQAAAEADAKTSVLEEKVAKIEAEKSFKKVKSTTKRTKKTPEERVAYRKAQIEAARDALKKLRTGESGLSGVPLPGVRELIVIAPHVKNIMVDLVEQGVVELGEVVKKLHEEFKDVLEGITEKNIHDIISGEYSKDRKPLSVIQQQIKDLQDEAALINKLESLLNGKEPKSEKSKRERNVKIKKLQDEINELRKEKAKQDSEANKFYSEPISDEVSKLRAIKTRNENKIKELKEKISNKDFSEPEKKVSIFDREDVKKNLPKERKEALNAIAKKEEVQHQYDLMLFKDEMARRSKIRKGVDFGVKLIHTSKAVLSGIDDSATFVQNGLAMLANPKLGAKVWLEHWKDAFSDARFKRELAALHARPDWEIIKNSGLEIVEPHSAASKQVEEAFEKNLLANKIKIKGKEFHPWKYTGGVFERAFTSMGNNMRIALFEKRMQMLLDEGKTFESHKKEFQDAARAINELTGRGKMPAGLAQAAPWITPFVWAPRMLTSTVNALGLSDLALGLWKKGYYQNLTPTQRKFALSQLGRGIGIGVAVMGAASLMGAKVDYDPRSVTFGDVIIGDHHYNVFGRFVPVVKALVQFALGTRIKKGKEQDLDSGKYGAKTRMGIVGGFFRGKMTPAAGVAYDLAEGRNYYTQKPFGIKDVPAELITPMSIDDLIEGWKHDGTLTILTRFLPAFEGMKVSDERDFEKSKSSSTNTGTGEKSNKKSLNKSLNKKLQK